MKIHNPVIIFDMDGVLFDSEPVHARFEQNMFCEMKIKISDYQKKKLIGMGVKKMWQMLKVSFDIKDSLEDIIKNDRDKRIRFFKEYEPNAMPGAEELLKRLKSERFRMAVASSSQTDLIDLLLTRSGFRNFFEISISEDLVSKGKPDPDIFIHTAAKMNADPKYCIVIEDSENGVYAAKAAGMKCIGFNGMHIISQDIALADIVVDNLRKIDVEMIQSLLC
jgi:HAD superfamily hydrolase (TIGR01509 family)